MEKAKEQIVGVVKKTKTYKLLKTSEAVLVVGGLALGIFLGWFATVPALILMVLYVVLNTTGKANEPLYIIRDIVVDKYEEIKNK